MKIWNIHNIYFHTPVRTSNYTPVHWCLKPHEVADDVRDTGNGTSTQSVIHSKMSLERDHITPGVCCPKLMLSLIMFSPSHWVIRTVRAQQLWQGICSLAKCRLGEFLHDSISWWISALTGGKRDSYRTLCVALGQLGSPFSLLLMLLKDNCRMCSQWVRSKAALTFSVSKAESVSLPYTELGV